MAIALTNNPIAKNAELSTQIVKYKPLSNIDLGTTELNFTKGQIYSDADVRLVEIDQHLGSPLTHIQKLNYSKQSIILSEAAQKLVIKNLTADVKISYTKFLFNYSKLKILNQLNYIYNQLLNINGTPYDLLDTNQLTRITKETYFADFQNQLFQADQDYHLSSNQLQQILNISEEFVPADSSLELYAIEILNSGPDKFYPKSQLSFYTETINLQQKELLVEQSKWFPEIVAGYFNSKINGNKGFDGIKLGVAIPIWYFPQKAKINEAKINQKIAKNNLDYQKFTINKNIENLKLSLDKSFVLISHYRENTLKKSDLLLQKVNILMENKDSDYSSIYMILESIVKIQLDYLEAVNQYNQIAIQLESYID